jgi:hypothetical protein
MPFVTHSFTETKSCPECDPVWEGPKTHSEPTSPLSKAVPGLWHPISASKKMCTSWAVGHQQPWVCSTTPWGLQLTTLLLQNPIQGLLRRTRKLWAVLTLWDLPSEFQPEKLPWGSQWLPERQDRSDTEPGEQGAMSTVSTSRDGPCTYHKSCFLKSGDSY